MNTRFVDLETFVISRTSLLPTQEVLESFSHLPDDEFLQGDFAFRKRAYSRGALSGNGVTWAPGTDFFQARAINEYAGGVKRAFAPAGTAIREHICQVLQTPFYANGLGDACYDFGLHQIRIICDDTHDGHPVPEGYHQDGFDFVAIHNFCRANITGGSSYLRIGSKEGDPHALEHDLKSGEILLFNDRRLFHYAAPITNIEPGPGFRDICVLTFAQTG